MNDEAMQEQLDVEQLCVLLVDDDIFVRGVMLDMLSTAGVRKIEVASNGKEASNMLSVPNFRPDLIFCDLHMPAKDGFQLMDELAQKKFTGCIALVSGQQGHVLHSAELMARFHQLKILAALEKPVDMQQLRAVLAACQTQKNLSSLS